MTKYVKGVNLYDFDHTVYNGDVSLDFIIYCIVRHPKLLKYIPRYISAVISYVFLNWTRKHVKQVAFSFLCDIYDLETIVDDFWLSHSYKIKDWYKMQCKTSDIIVSASPEFLLTPIADKLKVHLIATVMDKDTGKITGKNCRGEEKVRRLEDYDDTLNIDSAYGDSLADMPMLRLARTAYVLRNNTQVPLNEYKPSRSASFKRPAFIRFLFVGGVNALLGILLATLFSLLINSPQVAFIIGYSISLIISYFLNSIVTFKDFIFTIKKFVSFIVSYIPNFLIQFVCVYVLTDLFGLYPTVTYILAVIIAVPLTFLLLARFTFKKE